MKKPILFFAKKGVLVNVSCLTITIYHKMMKKAN